MESTIKQKKHNFQVKKWRKHNQFWLFKFSKHLVSTVIILRAGEWSGAYKSYPSDFIYAFSMTAVQTLLQEL